MAVCASVCFGLYGELDFFFLTLPSPHGWCPLLIWCSEQRIRVRKCQFLMFPTEQKGMFFISFALICNNSSLLSSRWCFSNLLFFFFHFCNAWICMNACMNNHACVFCVSRFVGVVAVWTFAMMCTLPSEGVSFCLSAAAKSLLNKKADVKVGQVQLLSAPSPFCSIFIVFFFFSIHDNAN